MTEDLPMIAEQTRNKIANSTFLVSRKSTPLLYVGITNLVAKFNTSPELSAR